MLAQLGRTGFEDSMIPVPGKSEFGMDTLTRKLEGYVGEDGELLQDFIVSLNQGDTYTFRDVLFYLQTWSCDDSTPVATVTLNYKGLKPGGTPEPDIQTDTVSTVGRITRSYLDQNGGNGITLRYKILWKFSYFQPTLEEAQTDEQVAKRALYITSATLEFLYHAVETRYKYITEGRPSGPRYTEVVSDYVPVMEEARIVANDGMVYPKNDLPAFNMTPVLHPRVVSWSSKNTIGSPYFECEDVVRLELADPAEFP